MPNAKDTFKSAEMTRSIMYDANKIYTAVKIDNKSALDNFLQKRFKRSLLLNFDWDEVRTILEQNKNNYRLIISQPNSVLSFEINDKLDIFQAFPKLPTSDDYQRLISLH